MEKHGLGEMSVNGELFADFCSFDKLVMTCYGRKGFPTQKGPQGDLGFSRQQTGSQIDHICVSSRFRRSLLDVRVKRGADVASDHHLLMADAG